MKKPDYMGEREFLIAIAQLKKTMSDADMLECLLPMEVDASYANSEFGMVPTKIVLSNYEGKHKPQPCYEMKLCIKLPHLRVQQNLIAANRSEIKKWLSNIEVGDAANIFLFEVYRGLSELGNY